MFAVRDQENLVHGHQQVAASKPLNQGTRGLQPKTPGNKYPKTPLKVPLNDENAPTGFGGKSIRGKGLENLMTAGKKATLDKNAFITPLGPRNRAPLGAKTTNAKAKAFQTPLGPAPDKEIEKTQTQASARRPKKAIHTETVKIPVHGDESPLSERDVEYAPPKPKEQPYESDVFPAGCLNYEPLRNGNLTKGIYQNYHLKLDENGVSKFERELDEAYAKSARETDQAVLKALEDDWTIGDVPETFRHIKKKPIQEKPNATQQTRKPQLPLNRGPATITSRSAASALSVAPKACPVIPRASESKPPTTFLSRAKPGPHLVPKTSNTLNNTIATTASRSTIGYTKGRSTSGALQTQKRQGGMTRSASNVSQGSDITITPARFAQREEAEYKKPGWLGAFELEDEDPEPGLRGALPECLRRFEEDDEEFVMTLGSTD